LSSATPPEHLHVTTDVGSRSGDVSLEVDLLGVDMSSLVAGALATAPNATTSRLVARRESDVDMSPEEVAGVARVVSDNIRELVHDREPHLVHMFVAAPVEVAVLIGHRLTSLHANFQLYERDGHRYVPTLRLAC
ncbi:MAG TPA: SAVED domain-containing protein, partial [Kofleriaceae bacterium]|nr:SAVED domain-containing protein [Kofleriaceae bacterium]